jgi:hypothetical protein
LQGKGGQGGDLGREIVVAGAFAADGSDGQDEVAYLVFLFQAAAFAKEQKGLGGDGCQEITNGSGAGTSHSKIDDGDVFSGGALHGAVEAIDAYFVHFSEHFYIVAEVHQDDVFAKGIQRHAGVPGQPIAYNVFFRVHNQVLHEAKWLCEFHHFA